MKLSERTIKEVDQKGWYVVCAQLEADNEALAEMLAGVAGELMDEDPRHTEIDALLASRNTQEPTCPPIPGKP